MADEMNGERASFEAWFAPLNNNREGFTLSRESSGEYEYGDANCAWEAWQARASLAANAGSEAVAYAMFADNGNIRLWSKAPIPHPNATPLYTHPSPPEGMVGGWTKASQQLPPCRDDEEYIGINTAGFAGIFNAVADINGNVYCMMETAEDSVSIMSDLDIWKPFVRPPIAAGGGKEAG